MSLSYSAITNNGKITLPSVDTWGTNMNILRDPPKSITTKRNNRVGQTSSITQMVDDSSDRACESIRQYARGVNPFVSVSFNNNGTNSGQNPLYNTSNQGRSAFLPYTVMKDGAFRPPVLTKEQLMPLSRQPRIWTNYFTKPGFVDFTKKLRTCGPAEKTKEVKDTLLKTSARPTAVFTLQTPIKEPFEVKYVIHNPTKVSVSSSIKGTDITQQLVKNPTKGIDYNMLHSSAFSNINGNKYISDKNNLESDRFIKDIQNKIVDSNVSATFLNVTNNTEFNSDNYIQDVLSKNVDSNVSATFLNLTNNTEFNSDKYIQDVLSKNVQSNNALPYVQLTSIEDIFDLSDVKVKDKLNIDYTTNISGIEKNNFTHDNIQLDKNLPQYNAHTNLNQSTFYKRIEQDKQLQLSRNTPLTSFKSNIGNKNTLIENNSNNKIKLTPKIVPGSFSMNPLKPMTERMQNVNENFTTEKSSLTKKISQIFNGH